MQYNYDDLLADAEDYDFTEFTLGQLRIYCRTASLGMFKTNVKVDIAEQARIKAYHDQNRTNDFAKQLIAFVKSTIHQSDDVTSSDVSVYVERSAEVTVTTNKLTIVPEDDLSKTCVINCLNGYASTLPTIPGITPLEFSGFIADSAIRVGVPLAIDNGHVVSTDAKVTPKAHESLFSSTYGDECARRFGSLVANAPLPSYKKGTPMLAMVYKVLSSIPAAATSNLVKNVESAQPDLIKSNTTFKSVNVKIIGKEEKATVNAVVKRPTYVTTTPAKLEPATVVGTYNTVVNLHGGLDTTSAQFSGNHIFGVPVQKLTTSEFDQIVDLHTILDHNPNCTDFYMRIGDGNFAGIIHKQIVTYRISKGSTVLKVFVHHLAKAKLKPETEALIRGRDHGGVLQLSALVHDPKGLFMDLENTSCENGSNKADLLKAMAHKHAGTIDSMVSYFGVYYSVEPLTFYDAINKPEHFGLKPQNRTVQIFPSSRGKNACALFRYFREDIHASFKKLSKSDDPRLPAGSYTLEQACVCVFHQVRHSNQYRLHRTPWNVSIVDINKSINEAKRSVVPHVVLEPFRETRICYLTTSEKEELEENRYGSLGSVEFQFDLDGGADNLPDQVESEDDDSSEDEDLAVNSKQRRAHAKASPAGDAGVEAPVDEGDIFGTG